ncbi:choline dehydrogenase [Paracoccus sp. R12_1]|uniref:choline dehydrogenase n=1 Tax=unclassified Paracoccus (in: a-proteobacteria) TaxID=2688777 RepID=UPI001ADA1454|nr:MULTISPECIES: choline dehydrogenase [unclassified Paracoccus (in: a-proteobacteria)]MBO9455945.1 choline dehydrogenase [Paracoccus sp. R12_2]MBO9486639.1 choline dehydrogenase [Paracoccus sp. R12_1]
MAPSDYVIVGAGSAGCALAYRLTEAGKTVTLIEFGGSDIGIFIQMPGALSYPMNMPRYDWGFSTVPEEHLGGRKLATPRGKVLGGSSSINGMVFVRGNRKDFDFWEESGATGWGYADVLPYFKRMESWHGGQSAWRGTDGPLHITRGKRKNPLFNAFIEAGHQAGWPRNDDYNGQHQEGFGPMEATIWKGRRWSAANAYLRPARKTGKLTVIRGLARRVLFQDNRAVGVEIDRKGRIEQVMAGQEVILSASSINTPKLLMLSGIGPADHLREHGIRVRADRPGVGANLQDHLEIYMQYKSLKPVSLYTYYNLLGKSRVGVEWILQKTGLGASNQFESCGFIRSGDNIDYPDIQYHFLPLAVRYDGKAAAKGHGFQAHVGPMRSKSRGSVRLDSADPAGAPRIHFNYMSHDDDWKEFRACVRMTRQIFDQPAFSEYRGEEIQPGATVQSDDQIDAFIREHAESAYHPCGTARVGAAGDDMAVVDPQLRVIGVQGLRVADSSIFPRITNGNLNGPSIMTGEKAADHILGRQMMRADPDLTETAS